MVGTVAVLGTIVGLNTVTTAVDQEMKEFAGAIRSLDQSYGFVGHQSCRAWTAGSYYRQQDVQVSLNDLCSNGDTDIRAIQKHVDTYRETHIPAALPQPKAEEPTPVTPNQIPVPALKKDLEPKAAPVQDAPVKKPRKFDNRRDRDEE